MGRFIKIIPLVILLLIPEIGSAAGVKAYKHLMSIYADEKEAPLKLPEGLACNDNGDLIIADSGNGRLVRYKYQDGKLNGGTEIKNPQLPYPVRLQISSKGEIFALDEKARKIARLKADGTFEGYLEPQGISNPGNFVPRSFKLDAADSIYVLDVGDARVVTLDQTGKFISQIPLPIKQPGFSDLTVAPNGDIYLLDSVNATVYLAAKGANTFTPLTKDLQGYASFPNYITSDNRSTLYLVDQNGDAILNVGYNGAFLSRRLVMGWRDGQVNYPSQICLAGSNTLFVADRDNCKVQVFEIVK